MATKSSADLTCWKGGGNRCHCPQRVYVVIQWGCALLVYFEGADGSGKDTQADALQLYWERNLNGFPLRLNEPDDTMPVGKLLRQLLASGSYDKTHAALFLADRLAVQYTRVLPAVNVGSNVVCSRSFLSTLVYQQEQWPLQWLFDIHRVLPVKPDFVFILDVDPTVGLDRIDRRGLKREYYESTDFQTKNRQRYLDLAVDPRMGAMLAPDGKIIVLDGSRPACEIHADVVCAITEKRG